MKPLKDIIKESKEPKMVEAYHYSNHKFNTFDAEKLQGGHDQKGPGLYASSEHETHYGSNLHRLQLDTSKFIRPGQRVNKGIIKDMIHRSPHLEDVASNYDEDPKIGRDKLVKSCCSAPDMHEAMERVWYDGYKADNHEFLNNAGDHFHGTVVKPNKFRPSVTHYVVWSGKAIKRIDHE